MQAKSIRLELTGTRPLVMRAAQMADPLNPASRALSRLTSKRSKTEGDHREIERIEWHGSLWLHDDKPCIPSEALEATFLKAAKSRRRGGEAKAGLVVETPAALLYDGPRDIDELWEHGGFKLRTSVRVGNARTIRTRPCFTAWQASFTVNYLPSLFSEAEVIEIYATSGVTQGLGDWRPKFGTFTVRLI